MTFDPNKPTHIMSPPPLLQGINTPHTNLIRLCVKKIWTTQKAFAKSWTDTLTDSMTHGACSHKVFPNGRHKNVHQVKTIKNQEFTMCDASLLWLHNKGGQPMDTFSLHNHVNETCYIWQSILNMKYWSLAPYQHNKIIKPLVSFQLSKSC